MNLCLELCETEIFYLMKIWFILKAKTKKTSISSYSDGNLSWNLSKDEFFYFIGKDLIIQKSGRGNFAVIFARHEYMKKKENILCDQKRIIIVKLKDDIYWISLSTKENMLIRFVKNFCDLKYGGRNRGTIKTCKMKTRCFLWSIWSGWSKHRQLPTIWINFIGCGLFYLQILKVLGVHFKTFDN